jgi:hypothetical protein
LLEGMKLTFIFIGKQAASSKVGGILERKG